MTRKIVSTVTALMFCLGLILSFPAAPQVHAESSTSDAEKDACVTDPYLAQRPGSLYEEGSLILPENISDEDVTVQDNGALMLECTAEQFASGRFIIEKDFEFDSAPVGRISFDGLADKKVKASADIYIDDEEDAAASFVLKNQMGKKAWEIAGDRTQDCLDKNLTGKHSVSFSVEIKDPVPDKKYKILLRSLEFAENSVPVLYFDIDESYGTISEMNSSDDHSAECYGQMTVQVPEGYVSEYSDKTFSTQTYELEYIRGRGNSTWGADKKPYKVKLDKKADLFGMGKNKHWILLANRYDNSLLRNKMTYWLGDQLGMLYTPQLVPVEVVMNGTYYGSYYLCEQIRIGDSRVAIDDLEDTPEAAEEPEITGGYLISMGSEEDDKGGNDISTSRLTFLLESPSFEDYKNPAQLKYIKNYMKKTESAIFGKNFKDKDGISYSTYMDVDAAIDYFWIQELSLNGDAYGSNSTYLYKTRDSAGSKGKLFWGPLWDFDYVAWGDLEYGSYNYQEFRKDMAWFSRLLKNKSFADRFIARWPVIRDKMREFIKEGGQLDQYSDKLRVSQQYEIEKWGYYDEFYEEDYFNKTSPVSRTYDYEITQLRTWVRKRVNWVDNHLKDILPKNYKVTFRIGKKAYKTRTVSEGARLGSLPKAPAKKGYRFVGWYLNKSRITADKKIWSNLNLKGKYVLKKNIKPAKKLFFLYQKDAVNKDENLTYKMPYVVKPANSYSTVKWSSSNKKIATVSATGLVTLKKKGIVKITGKISEKVKNTYTLYVCGYENIRYSVKSVKLNKTFLKLKKGKYAKLNPTLSPVRVQHERGKWIVMDKKIASVSSLGVVTGRKKGTTYIMYYMPEYGKFAKCKVRVTK